MPTITFVLNSTLNISETVRDRGLVPKDHQQEMAYAASNGYVTYDVTWPRKVKLVTPVRSECNIWKTAGFRHSVPKDHQYQNGLWAIKWLRYRWRHVTPKGAVRQYGRSAILATAWLLVWYLGKKSGASKSQKSVVDQHQSSMWNRSSF